MTLGNNMRIIKKGTPLALVLTFALVLVPLGADAKQSDTQAADGGVYVCNTASPNGHHGDLLVAEAGDPQQPVHNSSSLNAMANGNVNAAMHSRALSLCVAPAPDSGGGVDTGGGNY